jgi:hypothetical protein
VKTVDEGIELLTGVSAGARDLDGNFTADSINRRVEERLIHFSMQLQRFARAGKSEDDTRDDGD